MPYIKQGDRQELKMTNNPKTAGELNFMFTQIIVKYFYNRGANYQAINDVVGALEGAKIEFYRRVAVNYEEKKIAENGDVY